MSAQTPLFILSSGRAGSTLLARIIRSHPKLLCISDLFEPIGREPYFEPGLEVDGPKLFEILSRPSLPQRIAYWRRRPTAELLHLPTDDRMVSLLLTYTLPFLTRGEPTRLFEEIRAATADWPAAPIPDQLLRFFDWLRDRFGKELWVERTGGSLPHTRAILDTWPEARVVHAFRDCRETAISMMTGSFFRLYLALTHKPDLGDWDTSHMPPIDLMGEMLDAWIVDALASLDEHPVECRMDFAYERLLAEPREALVDLAAFLRQQSPDEEDRSWAEAQVRKLAPPPLRFPTVTPEDQERLERACRRGLDLLGYGPPGEPPRSQTSRPE